MEIPRKGRDMNYLLTLVGLVLVLEGIPWFLSPSQVRGLLSRMARTPDASLRLLGLTLMLIGLLLVYLGR
jgi:uncharacterized protein YjeT (DUF2065 family)